MTEANIILPDISLCAIVRDEKKNPAGGIKRFLDAHVPFVEEAVVVDTGSVDGTREILEEYQSKYPNLKFFDYQFDNYANARNFSLGKVKTKRALVLDADELLTHERPQNDFLEVRNFMEENPVWGYNFIFSNISPDGKLVDMGGLNPRLFELGNAVYMGSHGKIYTLTP